MLIKKPIFLLSVVLILALIACNLPTGLSPEAPDLALTVTAQARLLEPGAPPVVQDTPLPVSTSTQEFTPTITLTPTPSVPTVTVSLNTNCRTGPGTQYDWIGALVIGQSAEVVGKNSTVNYWIIKTPGGSGICWLWGQYATVSGNISGLTEYAIPSTPTPSPIPKPAAVKNLIANKVCLPLVPPNFQYTGNITWEDKSDNEKGFNIYFNGGFSAAVGPNITTYPIPPLVLPAGVPITMGVEAFNDAGKSATKNVTFTCP
ncbi:MAG: SH3 domain-containing protein [Anaerolineales bacterium]